jgi:glycosyltransferase involved in cell wall biosynthesis
MVKNESRIIERCLTSCEKLCDAYCFLDTGSTDNTKEIIKKFLKTHPGKLYEEDFINFGKSRTKSFECCVDYATKKGFDLDKTYGLLLDADMVLRYTDNFISIIKPNLSHHGYNFMQCHPNLEYHNTRLINMGKDWKCIGVTHEYWGLDGYELPQLLPKDVIKIEDLNDGGCKADKFQRDILLLEKGMEDEPHNIVRYTFYLAQSYEHFNKTKAIELYKIRIKLAGWMEEMYIAYIRIGDMIHDNDSEKVYMYIQACQIDNKRSEAFYRLAHFFRIKGENFMAYHFANIGLQIPYPMDRGLFIEKNVYEYQLAEEIAIAGYYLDDKMKKHGFECCEKVIFNRTVPDELRKHMFTNEFFYVTKMPYRVLETKEWKIKDQPFKETSCCFIYDQSSRFRGIQRTVNYSIDADGNYVYDKFVRTTNYYIEGQGLDITMSTEIKVLVPKKREATVQDLEDMRIVILNDRVYGFGTTFDYGDHDYPCQVLCTFDDDYNISKIQQMDYKQDTTQKNWCPFVYKGKLACIYNYEPFVLLEIDVETGKCKELLNFHQKFEMTDIRGSSNPVLVDGYYYQMVHIVYFREKRYYAHRLIKYDQDFVVETISKPFYFDEFNVEYCIGLGHDGEDFYIHYSSKDNKSTIMRVRLSTSIDISEQ